MFDADEQAHTLSGEKLKGLIAQVAGTDEDMTARIASTFSALVKLADFPQNAQADERDEDETRAEDEAEEEAKNDGTKDKSLRPEFHYNIQVHLPSNGTEESYLNIFNALRKAFR